VYHRRKGRGQKRRLKKLRKGEFKEAKKGWKEKNELKEGALTKERVSVFKGNYKTGMKGQGVS
jgi:hypothetical protein